jgi:hypothetical protein
MKMKNKDSFNLVVVLCVKTALSIVLVHVLAGCGPQVKITSDYDRAARFSEYKTFSIDQATTVGGVNQLNEDRVIHAVRYEMVKKGFVETSTNPDLSIHATVVVKSKQEMQVNGSSYVAAGPIRPYGYRAGVRTGHATVRPVTYREGTLVIDMIDVKQDKLVWTATGNGEVTKQPKDPDEAITTVVSKIMEGFPISNK